MPPAGYVFAALPTSYYTLAKWKRRLQEQQQQPKRNQTIVRAFEEAERRKKNTPRRSVRNIDQADLREVV